MNTLMQLAASAGILLLGACAVMAQKQDVGTAILYVDAKVVRSGAGTGAAPYKSISEAVSRATAGQTIVVRPGTYRETVTIAQPLTLLAEPGAVIKGSDVWSGWAKDGNLWSRPYPLSWHQHGEGSPRARLADQVFVNGEPLYQETSLHAVGPGDFYTGNGRIYLGTDPTDRTVEVTTRERWVMGQNRASNVTIKGFTMTHGAIYAQRGGLWDGGGSGWTIENNDLSFAHGAGVQLNGSEAVLRNNKIHHNGQIGIVTSYDASQKPRNQLVEGNEIFNNNTEGFNAGWEAGGTKFSRTTGMVVRDNHVHHNQGTGLWFDIDVYDTTITGNRIHHNLDRGITYELSYAGLIEHNVVWENGFGFDEGVWGAGILIQNSSGCIVRNNVVAWNADGIGVVQQRRDPWTEVTNTHVHDNVIAVRNGTLLGWVSEIEPKSLFESRSNNRASNNRYHHAGTGFMRLWLWDGKPWTFAGFNQSIEDKSAQLLNTSEVAPLLSRVGLPLAPESR